MAVCRVGENSGRVEEDPSGEEGVRVGRFLAGKEVGIAASL